MSSQNNFPGLERLLREKFADWSKQHGTPLDRSPRQWAKEITDNCPGQMPEKDKKRVGLSHSSLHEWMHGWSKPQERSIQILAEFFHPGDAPKQAQFAEEVTKATGSPHAARDPLDALSGGADSPIRVGYVYFRHFCNGDGSGFLDGLIHRLLSFTGLSFTGIGPHSPEPVRISDVEKKLCETGELDMVIGLFAEPRRSRTLWFSREIPILVPINAVAVAEKLGRLAVDTVKLRKDLTTPGKATDLITKLLPVVDPKELGGIYATNYLGFADRDQIEKVQYDVANYVEKLVSLSSDTRQKRLPLAIIDEVSCIQCSVQLHGKRSPPKLLFPPRVAPMGVDLMPCYRYSFAVSRYHSRWVQFLVDALDYYYESNTEIVDNLVQNLRTKLIEEWQNYEDDKDLAFKKRIESWIRRDEISLPKPRRGARRASRPKEAP